MRQKNLVNNAVNKLDNTINAGSKGPATKFYMNSSDNDSIDVVIENNTKYYKNKNYEDTDLNDPYIEDLNVKLL